jgi:endonuclease/exonuclease/phosphatase family metal-dependent hydrolase
VVSWNIEWFPKNGQVTADSVKTIIQNLAADVYALQEIDDTTLFKQVISTIPGYSCHFKSSYYGGLAFVYNTNTVQINKRYEIYTSQPFWNSFPRSPQVLEFIFKNQEYVIINNHLKCCGDGLIDFNDTSDEENRRLSAINLLKSFIDSVFVNDKVILAGDYNDILTDLSVNNIFNSFLNDSDYLFVDLPVALGNSSNFSFPNWPSHLDHILISNELFSDFSSPVSELSCIRIDDYMNSWSTYDNLISDHRPVGLKLRVNSVVSSTLEIKPLNRNLIKVSDLLGREATPKKNIPLFYIYDNGFVDKKIIID